MPDFPIVVVALIVMAWIGDWLTTRAERRAMVVEIVESATPDEPLPDEARAFITRLDRGLDLPDDVRREIELELRDHFADSIAALQTEGLDRERAEREAIARLGRPEELARQLSAAHRSGVRLLAGAAGGVFSAAGGVIYGTMVGFGLVTFGVFFGALLLAALVGRYIPPISSQALAAGTVYASLIAYMPAAIAARRAVAASAAIAQRPPRVLAPFWAVGGGLAIVAFLLFGVTAEQSWIAMPFELGVAAVFAVAALYRPSIRVPEIHLGRGLLAVAAVTVASVVVFAAAGLSTSSHDYQWTGDDPAFHYDHIAALSASPEETISDAGGEWGQARMTFKFEVQDPSALAGWHDLAFEAWRAQRYPSGDPNDPRIVVNTAFPAPYATQPIPKLERNLTVVFDFGHSRTTMWVIVATGIAPSGQRVLLTPSTGGAESRFSGSVWDWLTASE